MEDMRQTYAASRPLFAMHSHFHHHDFAIFTASSINSCSKALS